MTIGIKNPSNYYINLVTDFPPRPITDEAELMATQKRINGILDKTKLTQDDRDYLRVLGMLVYEYEEKHEPMPELTDGELLQGFEEKKMTKQAESQTTHSFAPYMKHYGKTPEEQLEKNKPAMALLKQWMEEEVSEEEAQARQQHFEELKEIIDSFKPEGHKLFSE